jgi:hypothetical protein
LPNHTSDHTFCSFSVLGSYVRIGPTSHRPLALVD